MTVAEFCAWLERHQLSERAAAKLLGMSRAGIRAITVDGKQPRRTIALACWAIDHGAPKQ